MTTPTQPPAATPDHQYSSPHATTESERQLFKSIACACASVGLLYDDGLKEAIYGFVLPHQSRIERENAALREALAPFAACVPHITSFGNVSASRVYLWKPSDNRQELPGISAQHVLDAALALAKGGQQ